MNLAFTPRSELGDYEWDNQNGRFRRPDIDRAIISELSERSTLNGLARIGLFVLFLAGSAVATMWAAGVSIWLAIPLLYVYYFFYGFWVAIGHELQHKIVLSRAFDWLSEIIYFVVQVIMWNSPRYARISHRLHHRYTMVRGIDPETDWPEVFTYRWMRKMLRDQILTVLLIRMPVALGRTVMVLIRRSLGQKDRMMRDHCSDRDTRAIRIESAAILLIHLVVVGLAIWLRRWEPLVFFTVAWQIGAPIEGLWHNTEHIGRMYNVDEQRFCTRSIRVGWLVRLIYWGLDDHVDHHMFPSVPSRNLPQLHALLKSGLAEPRSMLQCWREMLAIGRQKTRSPESEYVPVALPPAA
ncbi:MAG: hypothetical protein HN919_01020 [Verrucomicrobia bacterium]|jgi:fatty acid desaturase|nr:hypothetical protein [Verrucomicrobiota bacterium]MBT7064859.1 hypothetical protein [Verrucomicrobiota bacterium]MBT7699851.1 hypothetical protein [Verrucomicrobiota bacterium]